MKEVEAEVIEDPDELAVTYTPATVSANFDTLEQRVRESVAIYEGAQYDLTDQETIKDAKRHRSYLNGIAKQIDERRKAVKRDYMAPYDAFDKRARAIAQIAVDASNGIKAQIDAAEESRKADRHAELSQYYMDTAGLLAPLVPYERLHEARWLNKTCPLPKAQAELDEKVNALAESWETLKQVMGGSDYYDVAERELFGSLDLSSAISAAKRTEEQDAALAQLKAAAEPVVAGDTDEEVARWVIELDATRSQVRALAAQLKAIGLTGNIRKVKE